MKLSPIQRRIFNDAIGGHVHIRYGQTRKDCARHEDGGYSWNTMGGNCTPQTKVLEALGYLTKGPLVTEFGLESRRWIVTPLGETRAKELKR